MTFLGLSPTELVWTFWAIVVGIACTVPCALLGCYLVLRRMSLLGDAISHGVLPGIVVGVLLSGQITGLPIILGAMAFGLLTALLTQAIHTVGDVPEDASMGVVFSGLFALGVVLISQGIFQGADLDTTCVLYGIFEALPFKTFSWLGWSIPEALPSMIFVLGLTIVFILVLWKELKITAFDPALAATMGINVLVVNYLLMAMVAGVTVTAFVAVGSVLVIAMLIVPAACAHLLTDRLSSMMLIASLVAVISTVGGVILAGPALLDTNTPGMMAVLAGVQFGLAVFFAPRHGLVAKFYRNVRLALRIAREDIIATVYRREEALGRSDEAAVERIDADLHRTRQKWISWLAGKSLQRTGDLKLAKDQWQLTTPGRQRAERLVRSHRLWEAYLGKHFDLPLDHLHEPAERIEHFIGPGLQEKLASELEQPALDPHGRTIPPTGEKS